MLLENANFGVHCPFKVLNVLNSFQLTTCGNINSDRLRIHKLKEHEAFI